MDMIGYRCGRHGLELIYKSAILAFYGVLEQVGLFYKIFNICEQIYPYFTFVVQCISGVPRGVWGVKPPPPEIPKF